MNEESVVPVTVKILDKEYRVACEPHEKDDLIEAARLLDQRMREIRQSGRIIGVDRIAVMAALNISHEFLELQQERQGLKAETDQRLYVLQDRIADALATQRQLDAQAESV